MLNALLDLIVEDGSSIDPTQRYPFGTLDQQTGFHWQWQPIKCWNHNLPITARFERPYRRLCDITQRVERYRPNLLPICIEVLLDFKH